MDSMDKETQAELDRLEREIWSDGKDLSEILADDVLKDLDAILGEEAAEKAAEQPAAEEAAREAAVKETFYDDYSDEAFVEDEEDCFEEENKDGLTIGLLITASALCIGIIGVMIYWLENFL